MRPRRPWRSRRRSGASRRRHRSARRSGIAYFRIQRFSEAEAEFREILELQPVDHYAHFALGRCLEKQGKPDEAVGHYRMASFFRPQSEDYRRALEAVEAA